MKACPIFVSLFFTFFHFFTLHLEFLNYHSFLLLALFSLSRIWNDKFLGMLLIHDCVAFISLALDSLGVIFLIGGGCLRYFMLSGHFLPSVGSWEEDRLWLFQRRVL